MNDDTQSSPPIHYLSADPEDSDAFHLAEQCWAIAKAMPLCSDSPENSRLRDSLNQTITSILTRMHELLRPESEADAELPMINAENPELRMGIRPEKLSEFDLCKQCYQIAIYLPHVLHRGYMHSLLVHCLVENLDCLYKMIDPDRESVSSFEV